MENEIEPLKKLRESSNGSTRLLYHINFWDGPISGVCLLDNKKCYFNQIDEVVDSYLMSDEEWKDYCDYCTKYNYEFDDDDRMEHESYRIYAIYETPIEIMNSLERNHELFQKYVGYHTDYDLDGSRNRSVNKNINFNKFSKEKVDLCSLKTDDWKILKKFKY